jgi:ABC-type glycerol-3-phosphate transport system substrate-binding protein
VSRARTLLAAALVLLVVILVTACADAALATPTTILAEGVAEPSSNHDAFLAQAFAERATDLEVEGEGTVVRLLSDDTQGERHQRFIVQLASGHTLLVTHNIDVAPRIASLRVGDRVSFKGVYEWNEQGGLIHWTHSDPDGNHEAGWIKHDGRIYQ